MGSFNIINSNIRTGYTSAMTKLSTEKKKQKAEEILNKLSDLINKGVITTKNYGSLNRCLEDYNCRLRFKHTTDNDLLVGYSYKLKDGEGYVYYSFRKKSYEVCYIKQDGYSFRRAEDCEKRSLNSKIVATHSKLEKEGVMQRLEQMAKKY
ncbi:MAG: hypothetical protein ABIH00_09905 [Armatimonadota bacterium]